MKYLKWLSYLAAGLLEIGIGLVVLTSTYSDTQVIAGLVIIYTLVRGIGLVVALQVTAIPELILASNADILKALGKTDAVDTNLLDQLEQKRTASTWRLYRSSIPLIILWIAALFTLLF